MSTSRLVAEWLPFRRGLPTGKSPHSYSRTAPTQDDFDRLMQRYEQHEHLFPVATMDEVFIAILVSQEAELRELRMRVNAVEGHA